ncbi:phosphohydrolase [Candidatus Gottesmanbacteria bacterium RBG_13_45_10]|uniref:Phosphohydrolase n=1 Tax=Candidatus Gottesmanbacteria bacterium RBG_13_45_10 TaxID=1798370 RepID=A0A1F5ZI98_9BACT|nr:MAG: phosphohydrolase [Candidatus Gottesmanbacteria bacterium RBG_13_45_10]
MNQTTIHVPLNDNELLKRALEEINTSEEVVTLWNILNVNAINRMGMSDHGPVHFQIVANIALRLMRILHKHKVEMSIVKDFKLTLHHAELVVVLASIFHDMGMSIHRIDHEEYSLFLTNTILREILSFLPTNERTIVISETLHAIISHRSNGRPFTIEAGIVRIADALDMSQGRSRIPYETGKVNIHSLSAYAVEGIVITEGKDRPVQIYISMSNSAGIFQVDELLKEKMEHAGIEQYFEIKANIKGKMEKKLLKEFIIKY